MHRNASAACDAYAPLPSRLTIYIFLCAQYVLGNGGTILMLTIVFMAVTSAGSAEMMAVSSLVTYDIYKVCGGSACQARYSGAEGGQDEAPAQA